jgi:DNA repair exonuclease SbcCD ATPase subunit
VIVDLELTGWRAYDHVKVELKPGTTFIVARNGHGKTSLVQGAAYALFGDLTGYGKPSAIRAGFSEASASVLVRLAGDEMLAMTRTLTAKGSELAATLDGKSISEAQATDYLAEAFGSGVNDLARLTFLPAGSLQDYDREKLHLHHHLCRLFGVEQLQAVQADLKQMTTAAKSAARKVSEIRRGSEADAAGRLAELAHVEEQVEAARPIGAALRSGLAEVSAIVAAAEEQERYAASQAAHASAMAAVRDEFVRLSGQRADASYDVVADSATDVGAAVVDLEESTASALDDLQRERGRLSGRLEMLESTRTQLEHADADCPVCRRRLDDGSRAAAIAAHIDDIESERAATAVLDGRLERLTGFRRDLQQLRRSLSQVPPLPAEPRPIDPASVADAVARATALTDELEGHDEVVSGLRARAATLRAQIEDDAERQRQHVEAVAVYRREALIDATSRAAAQMVDKLITEKIVPLQDRVAARWKTVFRGSRPLLNLDSSGELKLLRGDTAIEFGDMSAGERAVALLLTRLLVLSVTAPNAFMWLDEPLEQLDPANRRLVGQLLASTATNGAVRQLVVTTFEEEIARRLEKGFDGVNLEYVTASD